MTERNEDNKSDEEVVRQMASDIRDIKSRFVIISWIIVITFVASVIAFFRVQDAIYRIEQAYTYYQGQ